MREIRQILRSGIGLYLEKSDDNGSDTQME